MRDSFGFAFISVILFNLVATAAGLWLLGSVITSGIKAVSEDCGTPYAIEKVVAGDFFCPVEVPKDEPA